MAKAESRAESNFEFLGAATCDCNILRNDFKGRVGGLWRLNGWKVEFIGELFLVKARIMGNFELKNVWILLVIRSTVLGKNFPINLQCTDAGILYFESLSNRLSILDHCGQWKSRENSVVAEADLVWRNNDWAATYVDAAGELDGGQSCHVCK